MCICNLHQKVFCKDDYNNISNLSQIFFQCDTGTPSREVLFFHLLNHNGILTLLEVLLYGV